MEPKNHDKKTEVPHSKIDGIPLPNEPEHTSKLDSPTDLGTFFKSRKSKGFSVLKCLPKNIKFEEIILIGMILLILNEEVKDYILLLILVYILY